jgi:hypothetical protein
MTGRRAGPFTLLRFLKMVRASLDRQIDTTVIVASCFPLVSTNPTQPRPSSSK